MKRRDFLKSIGFGAIISAIVPRALIPRPQKYRLTYWRKPVGGEWIFNDEIIESYGPPDIVIKPPYPSCGNWMMTNPCLTLKSNPQICWVGRGEIREKKPWDARK